jgi:polysaccharide chain length determinant protein (PEP-CTERM system associated)
MAAPQNFVTVSRRPPDIEDYIDMLRRYRSWLIGPMFAGLVISVVVAFMWQDTFVSTAVMRITPPQISERLVTQVVNMQMSARLQQMQQQITSRGSLAELIQRPSLDLYRKERAKLPLEDIIQDMRARAIRIQMVDVPTPGQGRVTSAFTISFSYPDRFKAQAVVRELVSKFMEENNAVLRQQTDTTSTFINESLKAAKDKMDSLEAQISKFRSENINRLPEQFGANVAQLNSLQMQLSSTNEAISRLEQQKMQLETQLGNATTQKTYYESLIEEQVQIGGGGQTVRNNKLDALNQRIMDQQAALASAKEMYTANHPQLKKIQTQLASLEKQFEEEQKKDIELQAQAASANTPQIQRKTNPTMVRMVQDYQSQINTFKTDIANTNLQIGDKVKQVQGLNAAVARLNSQIESSPALEQQWAALSRDYQMAKQTYEENHRKMEVTDTAKSLEEHKAGENLEVLDPPSDPIAPSEPNRLQIAAMGTGIGLMMGVVLAGAREMKNTSLKNLKDVRAYTNLPVLSSIPLLENALLIRRKRRLLWLAWSSAIIIGSIAMSGSAYYYYFGRTM